MADNVYPLLALGHIITRGHREAHHFDSWRLVVDDTWIGPTFYVCTCGSMKTSIVGSKWRF